MIRIPGRIPIFIHPTFWLTAAVIALLNSGGSLLAIFIWIGIIFVSILVHEMGHALTALLFGQSPRIELVALGGLTHHDAGKLPFWKQFLIVFNGPLFGFFLYIGASLLLQVPTLAMGTTGLVLTMTQNINLIWTILNLVPVMPLDGGQLLRVVLEGFFGVKGIRYAFAVGIACGLGLSLFFFLFHQFLIGALFFLFAFQSYDAFRQSRSMSEGDRNQEIKALFDKAEIALEEGKKDEAKNAFEEVRKVSRRGVFYILATQYLAFIKAEEGKSQEVYELLISMRSDLSEEALCLLHRVAFEVKNYPLVVEIGPRCFQKDPSAEAAIRNAFACAMLSQALPAVGWLQTALSEGLQNISDLLSDSAFDPIRQDPAFREFASRPH